jgi:uncharacterized protein
MSPFPTTKSICIVAVVFSLGAAEARASEAALKDAIPHLTVTGTAKADVVPDMAVISLGVVTERPQPSDAIDENARAVQAVVDDIKAQGIEARDIKTTQVSLVAVYETDEFVRTPKNKLRGYSARNAVEVRIRQIDKAGLFVSQWVSRGANQLLGLHFVIEHPEPVYEKLRGEAVQDAAHHATANLASTGAKLGRIIEIVGGSEGQTNPVMAPLAHQALDGASRSAPVPIEAGTQNLSTSVQITWELVQ